jgi:hypothetical protein
MQDTDPEAQPFLVVVPEPKAAQASPATGSAEVYGANEEVAKSKEPMSWQEKAREKKEKVILKKKKQEMEKARKAQEKAIKKKKERLEKDKRDLERMQKKARRAVWPRRFEELHSLPPGVEGSAAAEPQPAPKRGPVAIVDGLNTKLESHQEAFVEGIKQRLLTRQEAIIEHARQQLQAEQEAIFEDIKQKLKSTWEGSHSFQLLAEMDHILHPSSSKTSVLGSADAPGNPNLNHQHLAHKENNGYSGDRPLRQERKPDGVKNSGYDGASDTPSGHLSNLPTIDHPGLAAGKAVSLSPDKRFVSSLLTRNGRC